MRKFIPIIFISVFCSNVSLAATITCTQTATTECEKGCYVSDNYGCTQCKLGTYTSTTGASQCSTCNKPQQAEFTSAGTYDNGCSWSLTCDAGYHYVSNTTQSGCQRCDDNTFAATQTIINSSGYGNTQNCTPCGQNSTANQNKTNCNCKNGYHISGQQETNTTNTGGTDCIANTYTITYESNNGENKKETQTAPFNSTVTLLDKNTFAKTGHEISGWKNNNNTIYSPSSQITYSFTSDITLTAQWSELPFTVTYDTGNSASCSLSDQSCTYGQSNCRALSADNCTYPGYVFKGWKCTSGCTDSNTIININSDISTISEGADMTLTAQWEQCPAGHYCTDVLTQQSCPAGSTSDAGSYTKDKCHMTGGTTRICDTNENCFTLPTSVGNIFYQGKNQ